MIRDAGASDSDQIAALVGLLGHQVGAEGVRSRLAAMPGQLVFEEDGRVAGLCGLHVMTAVHRERPIGRITILVVAEDARGRGIGSALLGAAERRLSDLGCALVEVTSNDRLESAHQFYLGKGYERTSKRFAKQLA